MLKLTEFKHLLLGAAVSGTLFAVGASAQNLPANILWQNNFEQYSNGEQLATPATFNNSSTDWYLSAGNNSSWPSTAGLRAAVTEGGNTYGALTSPYLDPSPTGYFARVFTRSSYFTPVAWDHSANLSFGGDIQVIAPGNTATNLTGGTRYTFSGSGTKDGSSISYSVTFTISQTGQFQVSYHSETGESSSNSGAILATLTSWYTFAAEVDKDTNVIAISVYDRGNVENLDPVWTTSSSGLFTIDDFTGIEIATRHARDVRIAGFDNIYIGTAAIPEPSTTAALMLLGVGALVVYKRRRRS